MFAHVARMVVSEQMEQAVRQESPHLPVVSATPAESLTKSDRGRDDDLTEKTLLVSTPPSVLEAQYIGGIVPAAESPVQIPNESLARNNHGYFTWFDVECVKDAGAKGLDRAGPDAKPSLPVGHLYRVQALSPLRFRTL